MLKTEFFNMDKKKKPKRGFALRPFIKTTGFILDAVYIEKFLKVPLCGTFKNFSGFYDSAKRCTT